MNELLELIFVGALASILVALILSFIDNTTDIKTMTSSSKNGNETNDVVSLGQGDRGIMEFKYDKPGHFMIHSHFESQSGRGWEGLLLLK